VTFNKGVLYQYVYYFSGKLAVFVVLCEKYQTALSRDPTYREVNQNYTCL